MEPDSSARAVAIIGAGAIARTVGAELAAGAVPGLTLHGFLTREPQPGLPGPELVELPGRGAVVVEAASHEAVRELGVAVLASGADLICMSVGALADEGLRAQLAAAAAAGGSRLIVPSGAIAGLDLLRAAAESGLDEVVIEQRKPPRSLLPEHEADALTEARVLFDGPVSEVVIAYPKTTNVAAAVALAGLGFEGTRAVVVADPSLGANRALLTARGAFGTLTLQLDNVASTNPRTSAIVAYSVLATLRGLVDPLVVG